MFLAGVKSITRHTMSAEPQVCPGSLSSFISTSVVRARVGGPSYVVVNLDPRVSSVVYKVYPTISDGEPISEFCQSGELRDKFRTEGHSFVFPVAKKMLYFLVLTLRVDVTEHEEVTVTWLMDPFKRRQVTREDVAPAAGESPPAKK